MKNETLLIQTAVQAVENAAVAMHSAIGYIYAISENDFYNISVKDLFKISLSDSESTDGFSKLGIAPNASVANFTQLSDLIFYAFAVRIPYLRRIHGAQVSDKFIRNFFNACVEKGALDHENFSKESFKSNLKLAKAPRNNQPEPPFNGEWFRRWVYSYGGDLAAINNKNMFLLGCMEALLPLRYAKLTETLTELIVIAGKSEGS